MSKRMQVLVDEDDYRTISRVARRKGLTLAEWVRQVLRAACREEPRNDAGRKLAAIRAAVRHSFPTADIDTMLEEIARGYAEGSQT